MKFEIRLNNKIYKLKPFANMTIGAYNKIFALINNDEIDELDRVHGLLQLLTNIPQHYYKFIELEGLVKIDWLQIVQQSIPDPPVKTDYIIGTTTYKLVDMNKLRFGKFVELDTFLTDTSIGFKKIEHISAILLLGDTTYDMDDVTNLVNRLDTYSLSVQLSLFNHYTKFRANLTESYPIIFQSVEPVEDPDDAESDADSDADSDATDWAHVVFGLANDDISKVDTVLDRNTFEIFNFMTYLHIKNQKELDQIRKHS